MFLGKTRKECKNCIFKRFLVFGVHENTTPQRKATKWKVEFQQIKHVFPKACADLFGPVWGFLGLAEL